MNILTFIIFPICNADALVEANSSDLVFVKKKMWAGRRRRKYWHVSRRRGEGAFFVMVPY